MPVSFSNFCTTVKLIDEDETISENATWEGNYTINGNTVTIGSGAVLTVNGALINTDPENLIIEDGAQLIVNNSGVQATVKKNIDYSRASKESNVNWHTISSPLANSVEFTEVENLIPSSGVTGTDYAMFGEGIGLNKVSHRNAQAPMLYVPQDGEDFAIAFMDENTTIFPVSFKAMTTGSYSISLKATDNISTLVLVDNQTGTETNMLLEESYKFIGSPADNENRFTVKLSISHNDSQADSEHFVYQNGSELVVNGEGTLQIFDVLGRVVISEEVHGQTVNVGSLTTGAYIVRLTGESVKTQKIVVR